ncbi:hypothetical protein EB796_018366 [Bugula neritina]|uniref:Uncharacterized protein n=1 Tax=Bugula neritina TaxID=10212 RepID=A0A7J7JAP5_BUGNE|nr:hypothetical protein EB796_018366 [Bugula neritina]
MADKPLSNEPMRDEDIWNSDGESLPLLQDTKHKHEEAIQVETSTVAQTASCCCCRVGTLKTYMLTLVLLTIAIASVLTLFHFLLQFANIQTLCFCLSFIILMIGFAIGCIWPSKTGQKTFQTTDE